MTLSTIVLMLLPAVVVGKPVSLPIHRVKNFTIDMEAQQFRLTNMHGRSNAEVVINNYANSQYYGEVIVGGQSVDVIYDTGSSNLWVGNQAPRFPIGGKAPYDNSISPTYTANGSIFAIEYGSGPVSGVFSQDRVEIGGLILEDYNFAEVDDTTGLGAAFAVGKFDGILGMAWDSIVVGGSPSPFTALRPQLDEPRFAFYLTGDVDPATGEGSPGELLIGGVNPDHYVGEFEYVPLNDKTYWEIIMDEVVVGGVRMNNSTRAIVDSGTSLIAGPVAQIAAIAESVGANYREQLGQYWIDCDRTDSPDIEFVLGGKTYSLSFSEYIIENGAICIFALLGLDIQDGLWILGDPFMRKFYIDHDAGGERVGFALAK